MTSTKFLFYRRRCRYIDRFERRLYAAMGNYAKVGLALSEHAACTTGAEFYDVIVERIGVRSAFSFPVVHPPMPMIALADEMVDEDTDCPTFSIHGSDLYLFKASTSKIESEKKYDVAMTCRDPSKFDLYMNEMSKIRSAGLSCLLLVRDIPFEVDDRDVIKYCSDKKATRLASTARVWHHPADGAMNPYEAFSSIRNCFITTDRSNEDMQFFMKTHMVRDVSELGKIVESVKDAEWLSKAMTLQINSGMSWLRARKDKAARKLIREIDECLKIR